MGWTRAKHEAKGPKVLIVGPTGCYKTRTVLRAGHVDEGSPRLLVFDYEDGADQYEDEFSFARVKIQQTVKLDDKRYKITEQEVRDLKNDRHVYKPMIAQGYVHGVDFARVTLLNRLAKNPIDFLLIDPITTHYSWIVDKWLDVFLKREVTSKGHHKDYYTLQPRDYDKLKRDFQSFVSRLQAIQAGVFQIAHEKPKYAEGEIMKQIGMTADVHKSLPYKVDVHIHIEEEESGKAASAEKRFTNYIALVRKDRTHTLDARFVWVGKDPKKGYSQYFLTKFEGLLAWKGKKTKATVADPILEDAAKIPEATETEEAPTDGKVPTIHLKQLKFLKDELAINQETWAGILKKRGVVTAWDLPKDEAEKLIGRLRERLSEVVLLEFRIRFEGANRPEEDASKGGNFQG